MRKSKTSRKPPKITAKLGLTRKVYIPVKHHKKRGEVGKIYTRAELEEFAASRGWVVSKSVK